MYQKYWKHIDPKEEIKTSPFGNEYDRTNSYVKKKIQEENSVSVYTYNVYLKVKDNIMCIGSEDKPIDISEFNESGKYDYVKQCSK